MNQFIANVCSRLTPEQLIKLQHEFCMFNMYAAEQSALLSMFIMKWF